MKELVITSASGESRYSLRAGEWIVGRSQEADIRVDDPHVSGKHVSLKVTDGGIHIINLSRMGSSIDHVPVLQNIPWPQKSVLQLATAVSATWLEKELVVGHVGASASTTDQSGAKTEAYTFFDGEKHGDADGRTSLAGPTNATYAATGSEDVSPHKILTADEEEDSHTRALYTRPFDPDDINNLRELFRKKRQKKFSAFAVASVVLLAVLVFFWPRRPPVEVEVDWSKDAQGNWLDAFFDSPSGRYQIIAPDGSPRILREDAEVRWIRCDVGRDANIPLQIMVEDKKIQNYWQYTLQALVEQWMKSKTTWLFDELLFDGMFIGGGSGVPFAFVRYTRLEENSTEWVGSVRFFRFGSQLAVVQTETPGVFRNRMASLLSMLFVQVSQDFVDGYWDPVCPLPAGRSKDHLAEAVRLGIERDAPVHWSAAVVKFREALTLAAKASDIADYNAASQALSRFRKKQHLFYNGQFLSFQAASDRNEREQAAAIKKMCEMTFSDPKDARFQTVRRDWQLPD